jgi:GT2 family glycosyltransferase
MKNPWLTIITITKDDPAGLAMTLASAESFRLSGAEHIVVDGGMGAAESTPTRGENVRSMRRPARGISDAFNTGVGSAQGDWVWFLNGGDRIDPQLKPEFLSALLQSSHADVVIGATTYEGETAPRPHPPANLRWPGLRSWIPHPSTLMRRRLFEEFGGFDERYSIAMDFEWFLRVISTGVPVDVLAVPFAIFAAGGVSQRLEFRSTIRREQSDALRRHQPRLWRSWTFTSCRLIRVCTAALFSRRVSKASRAP